MKLYIHPISNSSRPVLQFCAEQCIEYEAVLVDILAGAQYQPDFLAINPCHKVPVLMDGDLVLTESSAILKYLADQHGKTDVYPTQLHERAVVHERMDWFNTQFYQAAGYRLVYPQTLEYISLGGFESEATKTLVESGRKETAGWLKVLDDHFLGGRNIYVCGPNKTLADYLGVEHVAMLEWIGQSFEAYPHVSAWMRRCKGPIWDQVHEAHDGMVAANRGKYFITV